VDWMACLITSTQRTRSPSTRQQLTPAAGIGVTSCAAQARSRIAAAQSSAVTTPIARRWPSRACGLGVMEIVSPDKPARDTQEKPRDYAEANIPEYWIINPLDATITVLVLQGAAYTTAGVFQRGSAPPHGCSTASA